MSDVLGPQNVPTPPERIKMRIHELNCEIEAVNSTYRELMARRNELASLLKEVYHESYTEVP